MKRGKQFAFYYDGDQSKPDVEVDAMDEMPVPAKDSIIMRKDRLWKVVAVISVESVTEPKTLPIIKVFLSSQV